MGARVATRFARWDWLFPLRGRWLRTFLAVMWRLGLFFCLIAGLAVAEFTPHLLSARDLRVSTTHTWAIGEVHGKWDRVGCPFVLTLGPIRFT
jgi:hypothetical protein